MSWAEAVDVGLVRRLFARRPVPPLSVRRAVDRLALPERQLPLATRLGRRAAPLEDGDAPAARPVVPATPVARTATPRMPAPGVRPRSIATTAPRGARATAPRAALGKATTSPEVAPVGPGASASPAAPPPVRPIAVPVVTRVPVRTADLPALAQRERPGPRPVPPRPEPVDSRTPTVPDAVRVAQVRPGWTATAVPRSAPPHSAAVPSTDRRPVVAPRQRPTAARPARHTAPAAPVSAAPRGRSVPTADPPVPRHGARAESAASAPTAPAATPPAAAPVQRLAAGTPAPPRDRPLSPDDLVETVLQRLGRELAVSAERRGMRPGDPDGGFGR